MPELSPQKRPSRVHRTPSPAPTPSGSGTITVQQLAKSQLDMQKQLTAITHNFDVRMKAFSKVLQQSSASRFSEPSSDDTVPHEQQFSDSDYLQPGQATERIRSRSSAAKKEKAAKKVGAGKNRKRPPSPSSESSQDSSTDDDDADSSPSARKKKARKVVNKLLKAAAPTRPTKAGKHNFYPHKFITRGNSFDKVGLGQATFPEYLVAMKEMVRFPDCPKGWAANITAHEEQLVIMAKKWDWPTCRLWTESVFMFVNKGGVPNAWSQAATILDIQRDVTSTGKRVTAIRELSSHRQDTTKRASYTYTRSASADDYSTRQFSDSSKQAFDKDKDGKPCYSWNWGRDCGFTASHGSSPDIRPHICAFCAYKLHKVLFHREKDCINKQRNADKMQALAILPAKDFQ